MCIIQLIGIAIPLAENKENEMKKYTVEAARTTGEWLEDPILIGEVEKSEWDKMSLLRARHAQSKCLGWIDEQITL